MIHNLYGRGVWGNEVSPRCIYSIQSPLERGVGKRSVPTEGCGLSVPTEGCGLSVPTEGCGFRVPTEGCGFRVSTEGYGLSAPIEIA